MLAALAVPERADADVEINVIEPRAHGGGHRPALDAWYDGGGAEIGDLCAYNYGARTLDGGLANEQWNGNFYIVQQEWDNKVGHCVQSGP